MRWETTPDDIHGLHPRAGHAHRARRDDLARGRRRAGDGEAVRRGLRGPLHRRLPRARSRSASTSSRAGDVITIDGGTGEVIIGAVPLVPPAIDENFGTILELGRRPAPAPRARERGHARGRREGARVRRRGDRPLPDRAHVHGRGPAPDRARDDPRARRGRAPRRAREAPADAAGRLRGDLRGDGGAARDHPPARSAAPRVPAAARGGDLGRDARPHPPAARGEPDARHARLPARAPVPRDLRDAGARDRPRRARRPRAHGRGAARRDHAPARRLHARSSPGSASSPSASPPRSRPSSTSAGR